MKMVKKILLGLALAGTVLALAGCKGTTVGEDEEGPTIINGSTAKAYLGTKDGEGYKNERDTTNREMKLFGTKHFDSFVALTLTDEEANSYNGQLGYVFNYTENKDSTVNFITVGYRNHEGIIDTYISQFYNIKTSEFDLPNFGVDELKENGKATRTNGTDFFSYTKDEITVDNLATIKSTGKPTEIVITPLNTQISNLTFANLKNDKDELTIGIDVIAGTDGSYTVDYYKDITDKYKKVTDAEAVKSVTIPAAVTGYTKKEQTKIGAYVAVYSKKTLNGFWRFSGITGEDIPLEEFAD